MQELSNRLDTLAEFRKYLIKPAGTFKWRTISGTSRLSAHSFGIAIDINVDHAHYWKWDQKNEDDYVGYVNRIPLELVTIFEEYGFIWGGKWAHYDTMHFEYRPELLPLRRPKLLDPVWLEPLQPDLPEPVPLRPDPSWLRPALPAPVSA